MEAWEGEEAWLLAREGGRVGYHSCSSEPWVHVFWKYSRAVEGWELEGRVLRQSPGGRHRWLGRIQIGNSSFKLCGFDWWRMKRTRQELWRLTQPKSVGEEGCDGRPCQRWCPGGWEQQEVQSATAMRLLVILTTAVLVLFPGENQKSSYRLL